ncbi:MAG: hypothetical protein PHH37_10830 [Paludibacter sp.]|nr:hypothetical protein [Paludibacter sp.]
MKYSDFSKLCRDNKISIKEASSKIGYTRQGLQIALDNETIDLRRLKLLCKVIGISPLEFFSEEEFADNATKSSNNNVERYKLMLEQKNIEIRYLEDTVNDKIEIIRLLKSANASVHGYGNVAEK